MRRELLVYPYFSRGIPHYADLLQVASPESIGHYLSFVSSMAREQLSGRPNQGLTLALELGDIFVQQMIENKVPINLDGKTTPVTGKIIEVVEPLALLPSIAMRIQQTTAFVDADEKYNLAKITFRQFCCIVSLAHVYRMRMSLDDSPTGVRAHHALLAASAYGTQHGKTPSFYGFGARFKPPAKANKTHHAEGAKNALLDKLTP